MPTLALPSIPESATRAVEVAEQAGRECGLAEETISRIGLAVAEAVSNAIEHGNRGRAALSVQVSIEPEANALRVLVKDEGAGVHQRQLTDASLPDDPLQPDGRGLYLIRELSDRAQFDVSGLRLWFSDRG